MIALEPVALGEKAALRAMFDRYLVAHADLADPQRRHGDPRDEPYFDLYWVDPQREPLWILAEGIRAGFVLLNTWSPSGLGADHAIGEFNVEPMWRRQGIGSAAVRAALAGRAGLWELQVYRATPDAMHFWPSALRRAGVYDHAVIERPDRVIHRFQSL
jgi:predicted acetyltransferase